MKIATLRESTVGMDNFLMIFMIFWATSMFGEKTKATSEKADGKIP